MKTIFEIQNNDNIYNIETEHNSYIVILDEKGTAIYQNFGDSNGLIKSYQKHNLKAALNYLMKLELIF